MILPENECPAYFARYIAPLSETLPLSDILSKQVSELDETFSAVSDLQADFRYAEGKWSLKEVLGHLIDSERVFAYRAMCISRGEQQKLPGFDDDVYVNEASFGRLNLNDMLVEFLYLRKSNLSLLRNMTDDGLKRIGNANGLSVSPRALFYVIAGHTNHHLQIMRERYLPSIPGPSAVV